MRGTCAALIFVLDHGNDDNRRETRKTLKKAGVAVKPNKRAKQKANKGQHRPGPHLSYMFARRAALLRENPGMERQEAQNQAMREWRSGAFVAAAPKAKPKRKARHSDKQPRVRCSSLPCVWGPRWPLRPEALEAAVKQATG